MFKIIISLAGIQFLQAAVQVLKMKFVALMLGPDGLGVISLINQFIQLVIQVSTLALPWVATRFLAVAHSHGHESFERKVSVFFRGILYLSCAGMAVAALLIWKFDYLFATGFQTYRFLALISVSMVVPVALKGFLLSVFTTAGKYRFSAVTMFGNAVFGTVAMLAGAYFGGLHGFFIAQAVVEYLTVAYCLARLASELGVKTLTGKVDVFNELKALEGSFELIIYGSLLYFMAPSALMAVRYSLLKTGGEQLVGIYQAVHGLVLYITFALGQATSLYLDPILKRDIPLEEKLIISNQYLRKISLVIGTLMVWVVVFPEFFLQLLYSKAFLSGAGFLFAFMLIEALNLVSGVYLGMLVGQGWYRTHFLLGLVVHGSIGLISCFIAPIWGIWGIVLAFAAGAVATIVIIYARLFLHCGNFISGKEIFAPFSMLFFLGAAGSYFSRYDQFVDRFSENLSIRLLSILVFSLMNWFMLSLDEKRIFFNFCGLIFKRGRENS